MSPKRYEKLSGWTHLVISKTLPSTAIQRSPAVLCFSTSSISIWRHFSPAALATTPVPPPTA